MNFSQFYENIILRDVIEYFTPGIIFLSGVILLLESVFRQLGLGVSFLSPSNANNFAIGVIGVVIAYAIGHLLTGVSTIFFRHKESEQATELFKKETWLKEQVAKVVANYLMVTETRACEMLEDSIMASSIREIGRTVIQQRMPLLHKEFVARLSILSRFCQNMSIAIGGVLISMLLSVIINWENIQKITQLEPSAIYLTAIFLTTLSLLGVYVFANRARRLRKNMIRYTFHIWYVDFLESNRKEEKKQIVS